ncbi:unnamed protein product [Rhodiola kirilowii]
MGRRSCPLAADGSVSRDSSGPVNPGLVEGMVGSLGDLIKLLDSSSSEDVLQTTYGKLQPPFVF